MARCTVFQLFVAIAVSFTPHAVNALTCATCPPTIVVGGTTYHHAGGLEGSSNLLQCDYAPPSGIPGSVIPLCLYRNLDGGLYYQNAGGCPAVAPTTTQPATHAACTFPG
ncbi:hypothetical protein BC629DRAFT_1594123 [Irpex lacteus]|nr:hypothetical protein BC629DRAFT_1594123 [Irpex lacteus]